MGGTCKLYAADVRHGRCLLAVAAKRLKQKLITYFVRRPMVSMTNEQVCVTKK